jgi:uncharacterized protein (DUF1697 family)
MRIAFLRGINVGGHNVKKEVLCDVFAGLDLTDATTFIASGNVLFGGGDQPGRPDADLDADLEDRIAAALEKRLGWPVPAFVRSPAEVAGIVEVAADPELIPGEGSTLQVGLWHAAPDGEATARLEALSTPDDLFRVHGRELYWLRHGPVHTSKVTGARLEKGARAPVTFRNITTMRRLVELTGA